MSARPESGKVTHAPESRVRALSGALQSLGFFYMERGLEKFGDIVFETGRNTGTHQGNRFREYDSGIDLKHPHPKDGEIMLVDIGGTGSKVVSRKVVGGEIEWRHLFEVPNAEIYIPNPDSHSYQSYTAALARRIRSGYNASSSVSLGIVWSNPLIASRKNDGSISGVVTGRATEYRKNEPFVRDLTDGDLIVEPFIQALHREGITVQRSLVSNDGPLIPLALKGAHGAVIASTGVNGTVTVIVTETGERRILNAEIGMLPLGREYAGIGDQWKGSDVTTIEHIIGGNFFPRTLAHYAYHLAPLIPEFSIFSNERFRDVARGTPPISAPAITNLAAGRLTQYINELTSLGVPSSDIPPTIELMAILGRSVLRRAARATALVALGSIANRVGENEPLLVALDSRIGLEYPEFANRAAFYFRAELEKRGARGTLSLARPIQLPGGKRISVAHVGLATACDSIST